MCNLFKRLLVGGVEHTLEKNKVLVNWMDRSYKGEQNRVNIKHILADAEDITVGVVVTAWINSWKYMGTVLDLMK